MKIILFSHMLLIYTGLSVIILFTIVEVLMNSSNYIISFANAQNKQDVNPACIVRGSVDTPPPFLVLHWMINGECNSTIDYFIHFYDVKAVVPFQDNFLIFLET